MAQCKTGCGRDANAGKWLCVRCDTAWVQSKEFDRAVEISHDHRNSGQKRMDVALVDFRNRMRAERQNRRPA